jgi:hypothetical protein
MMDLRNLCLEVLQIFRSCQVTDPFEGDCMRTAVIVKLLIGVQIAVKNEIRSRFSMM